MKRTILILVLIGFAGLFGWHAYRKIYKSAKFPDGGPPQTAIAVEVAPVQKCAISDMAKFTGSLLPRTQFVVAPKVSGRLEKLYVDMGDSVKKDQLVAVLDSQEYAREVEQARAELKVAKATVAEYESSLLVAKREFERAKALFEKKIASDSELDEAEANYRACDAKQRISLAQVEQKEAALKAAEVRLSYTQIRASWEGLNGMRVVGERYVDEGTMLGANVSILSLLDIDSLTAVIYVTEKDYYRIQAGQLVIITTSTGTHTKITGMVNRIAPALDEASRSARVEIAVPNPECKLKPGLFISAEIELARHDKATVVPFSALTKRNGKQGVFLLEQKDMKVRFLPVETGILIAESAEIVQPALEGYVVTLGHHLLEDGSVVILAENVAGSKDSENANLGNTAGIRINARGRS
ncbi:MAG: efflux RND transporter periplasmic adaptor subunit [Deltaproteobacteria bacterium]|nr:efflux RND transporter periplasmic adaptor subunit [Deltaproteobacteria bacterium]